MKSFKLIAFLAMLVMVVSLAEAHKKFYNQQPLYQESHERCVCDCGRPQPILPNKPYYGSGGYHQPRPSGGGYSNAGAGAYAVSGAYGSGNGQASGGY